MEIQTSTVRLDSDKLDSFKMEAKHGIKLTIEALIDLYMNDRELAELTNHKAYNSKAARIIRADKGQKRGSYKEKWVNQQQNQAE